MSLRRLFAVAMIVGGIGFSLMINPALAVHVNGYFRSNGTYVNGYDRTAPDGNPYNNYSYPGNYNPNTGKITGGNPSTYLNNYYSGSSAGSNSNSYTSTPTCPINSYSNGLGSCSCNYGYVSSNGNCISGDTLCYSQTGYSSSYDSLSNSCKCNSGYIIGAGGQCVNASSYCISKIGLMSQYDSSSKQCECISGYQFNGSSCVYQNTNYQYSSYAPAVSCPANSSLSLSDTSKCLCNSGFQNNATNDGCVAIPALTNDQACQMKNGANSNWNGTFASNGNLNCGCQNGYQWNSTQMSCVVVSSPTTAQLQAQMSDLLLRFQQLQKQAGKK